MADNRKENQSGGQHGQQAPGRQSDGQKAGGRQGQQGGQGGQGGQRGGGQKGAQQSDR